jgi:hypothetical protein
MPLSKKPIYPERWYEKYPNIRSIVKLSADLPEEKQEEIASALNELLQQNVPDLNRLQGFESVGGEIFLHLKKGYEKKRWYDHHAALRGVLNGMVFLPPPVLAEIDMKSDELVQQILSYRAIHGF